MKKNTLYHYHHHHHHEYIISICFGVQSIKHANVLSEKINFSALGGSKVAIFGGDDLDPIYFEVHMFLNPPGPPYMSKNAKMCYF